MSDTSGKARASNRSKEASGRVYGGLSPTERVADRRPRFVAAGLEAFGTVGYANSSIRGVCKAAGLTDRYFYEAFESLEDLLRAVYEHVVNQIWDELENSFEQDGHTFEEQLRSALAVYLTHIRNPLHARIMLAAVVGVSRRMDAFYRAHMTRFGDFIIGKYQATAGKPVRARVADQFIGTAIVGAVVMVATEWAGSGYRASMNSVIDACSQVIIGTLSNPTPSTRGR